MVDVRKIFTLKVIVCRVFLCRNGIRNEKIVCRIIMVHCIRYSVFIFLCLAYWIYVIWIITQESLTSQVNFYISCVFSWFFCFLYQLSDSPKNKEKRHPLKSIPLLMEVGLMCSHISPKRFYPTSHGFYAKYGILRIQICWYNAYILIRWNIMLQNLNFQLTW